MTRHFGVLIPSTNTTCEIEYGRLLPADLKVHVARLGKGGNTPFSPSLDTDLAYQSKMLGDARVEAIALAQTSASLFDDDYCAKAVATMAAGAKAPAVTSAQAIGQAVQALGAKRIAIATPYSPDALARAKRYYETKYGLEVVAMEGFDANDSYAIGKMGPENARDAFRRINSDQVEILVVPGGNFPTMPSIAAWEQEFGKPVITTNQAALWAVMRLMKRDGGVAGYGRLLAG